MVVLMSFVVLYNVSRLVRGIDFNLTCFDSL